MAAVREAKILDLQEYRRRRGEAAAAVTPAPQVFDMPISWTIAWVPVIMVYPVWPFA